ncbi:hypothetical protein [Bacillus suaedaesalsae]|uniref:Uncharacterized protein n=1 Tax=Bacillus suaedaesalsae TaxID=2810349 RepID=A0ABS2DES8_9BACI|nr:hypothetical protein [Bacillus suaedaesalsae]MBM6616949.1 hypothetical protein [Bacillus suaedaesalsae]
MGCECNNFDVIELQRNDISKRIKETKTLKKKLKLLAKHPNGEDQLYECDKCEQLWQGSYAWNFGNGEYLFKVPKVDTEKWHVEQFVAPDEILIYLAIMDRFLTENRFEVSEEFCKKDHCINKAVKGLNFCLKHHIKSLQNIGTLPQTPSGKLFETYEKIFKKYQAIFEQIIMS